MRILNFSVENFRSFRDETRVSFEHKGTVLPVVVFMGANASGKSNVLKALDFMAGAVRLSATTWLSSRFIPVDRFAFSRESREAPSEFALEFEHDGSRWIYEFALTDHAVTYEALHEKTTSRWSRVFERDREGPDGAEQLKFRRGVTRVQQVSPRELVLSRALVIDHPVLSVPARGIVEGLDFYTTAAIENIERTTMLAQALEQGEISSDLIAPLLQLADTGIEGVAVEVETAPPELASYLTALFHVDKEHIGRLAGAESDAAGNADRAVELEASDELKNEATQWIRRNLRFRHTGSDDEAPMLDLREQSDGTQAWLALIVQVREVLKRGGVLVADEIDSSLHTYLSATIIGFFEDPELNRHGAQLILTTHDAHLLAPSSGAQLKPEQVWIAEKSPEGATSLECLGQFQIKRNHNMTKRYLEGRFGGVPIVAPSLMAALLDPVEEKR
ncbi:AAA family ATPase [Helcobacillus massiliensis]|uniref:AAA family ATPase n=1 Tax=Helcobacillus massiliensis TaxID=521392 RepID=UPI0021A4BACD|nr:ATP-binding protein [Helcobacillus massiliensis]MCT1557602.1 AAA family ATPase [Helcobacillus massiliensis]MCT2037166.1 AAA family ATPase [Helcobacillus massiliensis]MCT2332420.1 AAA family ATPase [Helcobacillus massiliensis]